MQRLPAWFKQEIPDKSEINLSRSFADNNINTVCRVAKCPNACRCFKDGQATYLILGKNCTRSCKFCNISLSENQDSPLDIGVEPARIAKSVKELGLKYVVITSVSRDDLNDCGASVFAKTIELIRKLGKDIKTEVLIPDFKGSRSSLKYVLEAKPFVLAHNIETVRRLYPELRPQFEYRQSLKVLRTAKELSLEVITKSSIMLGLGETQKEVIEAMRDLRDSGCNILTLGQYLKPSPKLYPVKEFVSLEQFSEYKSIALKMGFAAVLSEPLARSSYKAEALIQDRVFQHIGI